MTQRVTKLEAAAILDVSASTIDRMIRRGELETETEPHGSRHKVWVLMDHEATSDPPGDGAPERSDEPSVAVLTQQVKGLEELVTYQREQLKDADWRYQQLMEQLSASQKNLEALTRALPAPPADMGTRNERNGVNRSRWWPFRRQVARAGQA